MNKLFLAVLIFCFACICRSQIVTPKDSSMLVPMVCSSYGFQVPGGDLAKRFGSNSAAGIQVLFKLKNQLILGVDGTILFGNSVKEKGILDSITTPDGFLIRNDGLLSQPRFAERGFTITFKGGRLFPVFGPNPNSGIVLIGGIGLLQHKIRIDESDKNSSPQLTKEFKKGYDRLTNGLMISEFIGYSFLSNNRISNFMVGFEFIQGFTQNRRNFDYDLMKKNTKKRVDLLSGICLSWVLPLYSKHPKNGYLYN